MENNILKKYNELEQRVQEALAEQPRLEAERDLAKREVAKKIVELKEMGVEFKDREDLERIKNETIKNLKKNMESLDRKLKEYEGIRKEVDEMGKEESDVDFGDEIY